MAVTTRIPVPKTYKLYIDGQFPRSESGRYVQQKDARGEFLANYCRASRKDLRDAVKAARKAQNSWAKRSAFNRSQILFRIAEMLEDRRELFEQRLQTGLGWSAQEAKAELSAAVDRMFWYAGWADKFTQVLGGVNPVALPFFNFTFSEPTGVVAVLAPKNSPLLGLISVIAPVILSGNTCVFVVENALPTLAIDFAEVLATSDLPAGVVNILTGLRSEMSRFAAGHMDINALACFGADIEERTLLQKEGAENVKRVKFFDDPQTRAWRTNQTQGLYWVEPFIEWKTAWHPVGT